MINDLSSPKHVNFNAGIPLEVLNDLYMEIGSIQQIVRMLKMAGKGSKISKHDLVKLPSPDIFMT